MGEDILQCLMSTFHLTLLISNIEHKLRLFISWGTWLASWVEHATLGLRVTSLSFTLGINFTLKRDYFSKYKRSRKKNMDLSGIGYIFVVSLFPRGKTSNYAAKAST